MRRSVRLFVTVSALVVAAVGTAAPAGAATCQYDGTSHVVTVGTVVGETAVIAREADAITVNAVACDVATVVNTDTIAVNALGAAPLEVVIDQSGGPFEPGFTPEPDGSEIEFTIELAQGTPLRIVGTAEADDIVVGADGINLNAAEVTGDVDVTLGSAAPAITVQGGAGGDVLSVAGGAGTGVAGVGAALQGEVDDDLFVPGIGGSTFGGGEGTDTVDFSAATSGITADLAGGTVDGTGSDTIEAVENVTGSPFDDEITGDDAANVLAGGDGDDVIEGGAEADTLLGGTGVDTVSFASSGKGVTVDLRSGTAEGDGEDTVDGFENVDGSRKGDVIRGSKGKNVIDGGGGADEIRGSDGGDDIVGNDGNDLLFGDKGKDRLRGNDGRDQLNGGDGRDRCQGGADPDAFVFCENIS